jgi:hypothetical protein
MLYLCALGAKESAIMLPALLLLIDAAAGLPQSDQAGHARRRLRPWLADRWRGLLALALGAGTYLVARTQVLDTALPTRIDPALDLTPHAPERIFTALQVWPQIVRLILFPRTLLADYGPRILLPRLSIDSMVLLGAAILGALVLGGVYALWRGRGRAALVLLWLPVALLPVSNILFPIGVLLAERTLYLPSFAAAFAVSLGCTAAVGFGALARRLAAAAIGVACLLCALRAGDRIPEWRSTDAIFVALLRDRPDSFYAHWHFARTAVRSGDRTAALSGYARALRLWPNRQRLVLEATRQAALAGDTAFARRVADQGVRRWPGQPQLRRTQAELALSRGDTTAAARYVASGLQAHPADTSLLRIRHALEARANNGPVRQPGDRTRERE